MSSIYSSIFCPSPLVYTVTSSQGRLNRRGLIFTHQCVSHWVLRPVGENVTVQKSLGLFFCVDYAGEQMLLEHLNVQEDKRVSEWAGRDIPKQGSGMSLVGTERKTSHFIFIMGTIGLHVHN